MEAGKMQGRTNRILLLKDPPKRDAGKFIKNWMAGEAHTSLFLARSPPPLNENL